jgi:hypothetical protein
MNLKMVLICFLALILAACNLPRKQSPGLPPPTAATNLTPESTKVSKPIPARPSPTLVMQPTRSSINVDDFFARCPTAGEINAINKDLSMQFESDPTAGTLACKASDGSVDLTPMQKRAYLSVLIMQELQFTQPLPWTSKSLYAWFTGTIKGIRFNKTFSYSHCCEPANVIDIKLADNSYLMLTDRWVDPSLGGGLQDTMILYVHEARHNEGLPHTCADGQSDRTIAELGAWGVQYDLLIWLAQYSLPGFLRPQQGDPNSYRQIALNDAIDIQRSRFCSEATATPGPGPTLSP